MQKRSIFRWIVAVVVALLVSYLRAGGYLKDAENDSRILMLVLTIPDQPGVLSGALQVLDRFQTNISYISSQENPDRGECLMKMGILIRDTEDIPLLEQELLKVCETRVLDYEVTDRLLDGTVFYETFTKEMKELLHLSAHDAGCVLIRSNKLMQILDEQDEKPSQLEAV